MLPRCSPRQQQDRNVRAANDQQREYRTEQQRQRSGELAQHLFVQTDDLHLAVLRKVLVLFRKFVGKRLKLRFGSREFRSRLQFHERKPIVMRIGGRDSGNVHIGVAPSETRRYDANHSVKLMIQFNGFANDIAASTELALPEQIAEHSNAGSVPSGSIRGREFASQKRRYAHVFKEVRRVQTDIHGNRYLVPGEVLLPLLLQEDIIQGGDFSQLFVSGAIDNEKTPALVLVIELNVHHPVVVLVRIRIEQYAIDNAEDSGRGADAKHQGENRGNDKARRLAKLAKCEAQVLQQGPHGCLRKENTDLDDICFRADRPS